MKIGLYFNDQGYMDLDLQEPQTGNNGIGGTQYCFIMLADALVKYTNHEVIVFHFNNNLLPVGVQSVIISDKEELIERATNNNVDILLFKAEGVTPFVKALRDSDLKCIVWAHNYLLDKELDELLANQNIKKVVFVGKEQYDRYVDHDIIEKSTYIFNMFDGRCFKRRNPIINHNVTYTGSIVRSKGFHILASIWPDIIKEVPDANLFVIGNGQLYDRNAKLGRLGITNEEYETTFAPFITFDGEIIPSVHFLGTLGKEKTHIYDNTSVGVVNPSGRTETFGLSAVEMEACGIPVVTKAANGLFDTVINNKTGYLVRNKRQLKTRIIKLLKDTEKNDHLGSQAKEFADTKFLPENIIKEWEELFYRIRDNQTETYKAPNANFRNNLKWLRIIIRSLRRIHIPAIPLIYIECKIKRIVSS